MDNGNTGHLDLNLIQFRAQRFGGVRHQRTMRGHADRNRHRAPRTHFLRMLHREFHRGRGTGNHHLARCIEVRRLDDAIVDLRAGGDDILVVEPDDHRHRALALRYRGLHQLAAPRDQPDCIGELDAAAANQRGVLAEAVSGHQRRRRHSRLAAGDTPAGDTCTEHRGLRDLGTIQIAIGTIVDQGQ